ETALCLSMTGPAIAAINCKSPPVLVNPVIYEGKCPGESGLPNVVKSNGKDVFIKLPENKICSGKLVVSGARNTRITGGQFIYNDSAPAVITLDNSSGISFLDGLHIDVNKKYADAIRTYKHTGQIIIQNAFVKGISGTVKATHGDLMHAQGGGPLQELTLQNVTGLTGYQGLFAPYRPSNGHGTRKLTLDRVNIGYDPGLSKSSGAGKPLKLLYIGSADNSTDRVPDLGSNFSNVFVNGSYWNIAYYKTVYAQPITGSSCATFEEKHKVSGQVCDGIPADGDYAPAARVGQNYNRDYFCSSGTSSGDGAAPGFRWPSSWSGWRR
ncbi:MAG: hypothetical protein ACSLEZ_12870, partial [Thiobacillus sp.]